ncbi:plastocyanin/azurin family copper-binding protein [Paradevosia shaoguanensis]|uniref:plastocyanin/azurin family copper-binding protein n=1 Tax=Paradevosia shaoguanensis TaxID=1335043 RepID=UPI003C761ECA
MRRRTFLVAGGGVAATLLLPRAAFADDAPVEIAMTGKPDGSRVWFDPIGIHILPGQTLRWTNRDPGNSHTATSYHPSLNDHPLRMPKDATPWDSDYLLPDESFSVTFTVPGVYDYYCVPHEHAGMVGRIVVGEPPAEGWWNSRDPAAEAGIPAAALATFPSVEDIVREGAVRLG